MVLKLGIFGFLIVILMIDEFGRLIFVLKTDEYGRFYIDKFGLIIMIFLIFVS